MSEDAIKKDFKERLAKAKKRKADVELEIREAYFFVSPERCRDMKSAQAVMSSPPKNQGDLQTSLGMECGEDFVNEVIESFMPESVEWCDQMPSIAVDQDAWDGELKEKASLQTELIHRAMKESNFYAEAAVGFNPDLPVGTVGMWIDRIGLGEIACRSIPIRKMEIDIGPDGKIDTRFIVERIELKQLPALLAVDVRPKNFETRLKNEGAKLVLIQWGFWRNWSAPGIAWKMVIMVDDEVVDQKDYEGEGSCPFIVARFNPDPNFPFGVGPGRRQLPELRKHDESEALRMESAEFQVRPPFLYNDDSVINLSGGLEAGMGYPARLGPGMEPRSLAFGGDLRFAEYDQVRTEDRIRRGFYCDYPQQRGKTPPTAAQWLDEMAMRQRRLGVPGKVFWQEGPREYFMRFRYLLEVARLIEPLVVDGKALPLAPYNPTEKAKEHANVLTAERMLQLFNQMFPDTSQVIINAEETMANIKSAMRDQLVVLRPAKEIQGAIDQFAPILGQAAGGADPAAAMGGMMPGMPQ